MNSRKTILVVDDEPTVLELVCRMLQLAAYDVCAANDVTEAKRRLCLGPGVDAVLTDYDLPDGTGLELLAWLRDRDEGNTPVVIMSGGCCASASEDSLSGFEFLPKPFSPGDLFFALDQAFQNAPQSSHPSLVTA